jgi:hypothetical protein
MQFKVPQFIDVEDKIFGPFTFKQFIYLTGGGGIIFILYKLLPFYLAIIFILPVGALAGALAFYRINNKPFIFIMQAYFRYLLQDKLFIWKKEKAKKQIKKAGPEAAAAEIVYTPKLSGSKLKDIAWSLDVLDLNRKEQ